MPLVDSEEKSLHHGTGQRLRIGQLPPKAECPAPVPAEEHYRNILMEPHGMPTGVHHLTISVCDYHGWHAQAEDSRL
jgi:hypothetical protein